MSGLRRILVATDFGEASATALAYGRAIARRYGASLDVLHVTENVALMSWTGYPDTALPASLQFEVERDAQEQLERLLRDDDRRDLGATAVTVTDTMPAEAIVAYASEHGIDLIVMGTHGRTSLAHILLGSVAERVVRLAPCPVLTVHHAGQREFHRSRVLSVATSS